MAARRATAANKTLKPPARDRIIDAAYRCFGLYGTLKTTMADIAREAHVSRRTVYAYFATKEDLINEVAAIESVKNNAQIRRLINRNAELEDRLAQAILLAARIGEQAIFPAQQADAGYLNSVAADPRSHIHKEQRERWRSLIEPALKNGRLANDLTLDEVVSWLSLAHYLLVLRIRAGIRPADLSAFIKRFIVEPLLPAHALLEQEDLSHPAVSAGLAPSSVHTRVEGLFTLQEDRILRAASQLAAKRGLEKVSLGDVAETAKVGRRTIYRYFRNRAELLEKLSSWQYLQISNRVQASLPLDAPVEERLTEYFFQVALITKKRPDVKLFNKLPSMLGRLIDPSSSAYRIIHDQCAPILRDAQQIAPDLSGEDIFTWIYLAKILLQTKLRAVKARPEELRWFIRRFLVEPILAGASRR